MEILVLGWLSKFSGTILPGPDTTADSNMMEVGNPVSFHG